MKLIVNGEAAQIPTGGGGGVTMDEVNAAIDAAIEAAITGAMEGAY